MNTELQAACIEAEQTFAFAAEVAGMALDRAMLIDGPAMEVMESPESILKTAFGLVTTLHGLQRLLTEAAEKLERLDLHGRSRPSLPRD